MPTVRELSADAIAAAACAGIYDRSWPITAVGSFTDGEIAGIAAERPVAYWAELLSRSTVRGFASTGGACGFVLVTPEPDGLELSYLFVEPAAFGTGLADRLYRYAIEEAGRPMHCWVLEHNTRSLRFFARQGWRHNPAGGRPPWPARPTYVRLEQPEHH